MQFLCRYLLNAGHDFVHKHPAKSLYLYVGAGTSKPSHLFSSHEEADTKMVFNAIDAVIKFEKSHEKWQIIIDK